MKYILLAVLQFLLSFMTQRQNLFPAYGKLVMDGVDPGDALFA